MHSGWLCFRKKIQTLVIAYLRGPDEGHIRTVPAMGVQTANDTREHMHRAVFRRIESAAALPVQGRFDNQAAVFLDAYHRLHGMK